MIRALLLVALLAPSPAWADDPPHDDESAGDELPAVALDDAPSDPVPDPYRIVYAGGRPAWVLVPYSDWTVIVARMAEADELEDLARAPVTVTPQTWRGTMLWPVVGCAVGIVVGGVVAWGIR